VADIACYAVSVLLSIRREIHRQSMIIAEIQDLEVSAGFTATVKYFEHAGMRNMDSCLARCLNE
jgi:hypothetical protein